MPNESNSLIKLILSILLFPMAFQESFLQFAWGMGDSFWLAFFKRLFLLLPTLAFLLGCWVSVGSLLSVIIRQDRKEFVTALFATWWDLGKAIAAFWGGILRFFFTFFISLWALLRVFIFSLWAIIQDLLLMPISMMRAFAQSITNTNVPYLAILMTLGWCLIEAGIFTYVMTPVVLDVFSNITGESLTISVFRIPLFLFLFVVVLGSYAVLSNLVDVINNKNIAAILVIIMIELVVLFVEVVWLYREFVDSLIPWLAQRSENFELGILGTLVVSTMAWFGVRSVSWFLFANHGTPVILAVIQGRGIEKDKVKKESKSPVVKKKSPFFEFSASFIDQVKSELAWIQTKGTDVTADFMLPPLQVVAAAINFCILLITSNHLFEIPLKNIDALKTSKELLHDIFHKGELISGKKLKGEEIKASK